MKRYLTFIYNGHQPHGGWQDFFGDHDSVREAITDSARHITTENDEIEIVDSGTMKTVYRDDAASIDAEAGVEINCQ
jgi:hypothetical protein